MRRTGGNHAANKSIAVPPARGTCIVLVVVPSGVPQTSRTPGHGQATEKDEFFLNWRAAGT